MPYTLAALPYATEALEPYLDAATVSLHHDKHHQTYVDKLNEAIAKHPELADKTVEDLLGDLAAVPEDIRTAVRNHGGGVFNHNLFWQIMGTKHDQMPAGELASAIDRDFVSFEEFKKQFSQAGLTQFGSGWAFLVKNSEGKLQIAQKSNQDCPLSDGLTPILALDVWEHAYYLKFQNRRAEFIENWWHVVNWESVAELYK